MKKRKMLLIAITGCSILVIVLFVNQLWLYLLCCLAMLIFILNKHIYDVVNYNSTHLFSTVERNYDILVIGELCDISKITNCNASYISFLSPSKRSLDISFELIKRLYSLIDESSGEIYLVLPKKPIKQTGLSVFDIPYLHRITLTSLGIYSKRWLCKFPLLVEPMASVRFLFHIIPQYKLTETVCPSKDIIKFCQERKITFHFYT